MNLLDIYTEWTRNYQRVKFLQEAFMTARTQNEVSEREFENWDFMEENPSLFYCAKQARKRIARIDKERKRSFKQFNLVN